MDRPRVAALIAALLLSGGVRAQDAAQDLERDLTRITDPALPVSEQQAAWLAVVRAVDGYLARTEPLDDADARAFVAAANFYLRCLDGGVYDAQRVEPVLARALRLAAERPGWNAHAGYFAFRLAQLRLGRAQLVGAREALDVALPLLVPREAAIRGWCLLLRATVDRLDARQQEARGWLDLALAEVEPAWSGLDRRLAPSVHAERVLVWLELGLPELAARELDRQRATAEGIDDPAIRNALLLNEGHVDLASERWTRARERAHSAAEAATGTTPAATALRAQHRLVESLALHELAAADRALAPQALALLRESAESSVLARGDRVGALLALFTAHARSGDTRSASAVVERLQHEMDARGESAATLQAVSCVAARAREARMRGAPKLELAQARDALRAAWAEFRAMWNRTPVQAEGVGFLQYSYRRSVPCELIEAELAADPGPEGVERAFTTLLEAQACGTLARTFDVGVPIVAELRRDLLAEGESVLAYLPGPVGSHAFLLDAQRLVHAPLAPEAALRALQREFAADLLVRPAADAAPPAVARRLAEALFPKPLDGGLRASRLTFSGLELLGFLPPAALDAASVGILGLAVEIEELPSLPIGLLLARRPQSAPDAYAIDLLVLAAPEASSSARERWSSLAPLPWSSADEHALRGGAADPRVVVLAQRAARVGELAARRPRIATVHAHGVQDARRSQAATLVLAPEREGDEGLLRVEDAVALWSGSDAVAPQLVVLAACGGSRAPMRRGDDGGNHFGGALLAAGARCVVLSAADLDDDATRVLLEALHRELRAGATPSRALLVARKTVAADARFGHPHYHALIGASGLGHRVPR